MAVGGSLESVTLDGRIYPVAADAEVQHKNGGYENEVESNGDGSARQIKTRVAWSLSGISLEVDNLRGDEEHIQALANRRDFFPISATYASGAVYNARGTITGENPTNTQNATKQVMLSGPGELTLQ